MAMDWSWNNPEISREKFSNAPRCLPSGRNEARRQLSDDVCHFLKRGGTINNLDPDISNPLRDLQLAHRAAQH